MTRKQTPARNLSPTVMRQILREVDSMERALGKLQVRMGRCLIVAGEDIRRQERKEKTR